MENEEYLNDLDEALVGVASQKSETDLYLDSLDNALNHSASGGKGLLQDTNYFGGLGFGESKYDDMTLTESRWDSYGRDINEMRAQRQPWIDKAGAGLTRVGAKVIQEVAKMPGMLVGSLAAPLSDNPWETAFNNTWINTINEFAENINEENLPVYVKKAVREGNLWDNISSIDFWATEGADGIGFMASMLIPGLALSKLGAGSKIVKGLSKGAEAVLGSSDEALNVLKSMGVTSNNVDILNATIANTLFEAGAEAGGAMKDFEEKLVDQLKNGEISKDQFDKLIASKGELGRDIFVANTGILLGPNLIANKIILGKSFGNTLKKSDIYKKGTMELLNEIPALSGKARVKDLAKRFLKAYANPREGFIEEGFQTTAQTYYTEKAESGEDKDFLGDFANAYLDMISTTDGQKAVFLGQFLGGPMNLYQGYKEGVGKRQKHSNLVNAFRNNLNGFSTVLSDVYKKNGEEYVLDENGKRIIDPLKAEKVGDALNQIEDVNNILEVAQLTGNKELYDGVRSQIIDNYVMPFVTEGDMGIEILKEQLNSIQEIAENVEKYNKSFGTNLTKKSFINDIIRQAESIKEDYERYDTFGRDLIKLENKNATRNDMNDFYGSLTNNYLLTRSRKRYMSGLLDKLNSEKSKLDTEYATSFSKSKEAQKPENQELLEEIKKSKPLYQNLLDNIAKAEENLSELEKQEDSFFDQELANKEFNKIVKRRLESNKKEENKESEKAEETINKVKDAENEEQVDEAIEESEGKVSDETQQELKKEAKKRKIKLDDDKKNQASEQINKISTESKQSNERTFEHGEEITIGEDKYILNKEGDKHFRTVGIPGESWDAEHSGKVWDVDDLAKEVGIIISEEIEDTSEPSPVDSTEGGEITKGITKKDTVENIIAFNNEGQTNPTTNTNMPSAEELADDDLGREDVKVIGVDPLGTGLKFVDSNFISYLRNGISKIGDKVFFELGDAFDDKSSEAIRDFNGIPEGVDTVEKLVELSETNPYIFNVLFNLPIRVITKEGFSSYLTGRPVEHSSKQAKEIFNQNELPLRRDIILAALSNGKSFEGISSTIEFQYPGLIKKAPLIDKKVPENNILDLFGFEKPEDVKLLVSSDELGNLFDENKEVYNKLSIKSGSKKGWVYMEVPMANGRIFPMKLNISRVKQEEAELLYRLYQEIFASKEQNSISLTLEQLTGTLQNDLKTNFKEELDLFDKPYSDIRVYDLIDLFVYSTKESSYRFESIDGSLNYGPNRANRNALPEFRESIIKWLTTNKRRHINFKALAGETDLNSKKYKAYLIKNKVLNTDTVIDEPIFQGNTNIYINKKINIEKAKKENIVQAVEGLRTARKGDKGVYWTNFKGNRQDWELDKTVTVKAVSKNGVLFEEDPDWKNFKDNWHNFKNITRTEEISGKKTEKKSENILKSQKDIVPLQQQTENNKKAEKSAQKGFGFMKAAVDAKKPKGPNPKTNCK